MDERSDPISAGATRMAGGGSVQAIAQQTLRRSKIYTDFVSSFSGRIQSLASAHGLLSATTWQGADLEPFDP